MGPAWSRFSPCSFSICVRPGCQSTGPVRRCQLHATAKSLCPGDPWWGSRPGRHEGWPHVLGVRQGPFTGSYISPWSIPLLLCPRLIFCPHLLGASPSEQLRTAGGDAVQPRLRELSPQQGQMGTRAQDHSAGLQYLGSATLAALEFVLTLHIWDRQKRTAHRETVMFQRAAAEALIWGSTAIPGVPRAPPQSNLQPWSRRQQPRFPPEHFQPPRPGPPPGASGYTGILGP